MFTGGDKDRGPVQRICAWAGLLLIAASLAWLESFPPSEYRRPIGEAPTALDGPITHVVIDPGHGGNDSGTMHAGVSEKDLTLDVARRLDLLLRTRGLTTTMTRSGDETVSLGTRAAVANQEHDCVFVSIHFDESRASATGVQTFYAGQQTPKPALASSWWPFAQKVSSSTNPESQNLAGMVQDELVVRTQAFDRGTRAQQFYVIANVYHPAVLVEGGFLTNNDDMAKLTSDEYRQQLAVALSEGIMRYREMVAQGSPTLALSAPGR